MKLKIAPYVGMFLALLAAALMCRSSATAWADAPAAAEKPSRRAYDVRQFGATGDGKDVDTVAIQKALDTCGKDGGGTVLLPPGTYLSQPIFLRDNVALELAAGATLKAVDNRADFVDARKTNGFFAFVNGRKLHNIAITGSGTIDGSGAKWWVPAEEARRKTPGYTLPRPRMVLLVDCKDVRIENVTLKDSPSFHLVPMDCENVVISNVTVLAPADSPNTDAIDPSASKNVLITHCLIDVGDDNIAIKAGHKIAGREFACEDVTITHCTFRHGHGMSIGSETAGGVRNVLVRDCTFENTENGIRIKSDRRRGGRVENIEYRNITMKDVNPAITLTCYYMNNSAGDARQSAAPIENKGQPVTATTPMYRNIRIQNLTATCQKSAGIIWGLPESPISDVLFESVHITAATTGLVIRNAKGVHLKAVQVESKEGPSFVTDNSQVEGLPQDKSASEK